MTDTNYILTFLLLCWFTTTFTEVGGSKMSYSRSIVALEKLAYSELKILKQIIEGKSKLPAYSRIHGHIEPYLQDCQWGNGNINWTDWDSMEKSKFSIARNPISAYRLVRRYSTYLPYVLTQVRTQFDVSDDSGIEFVEGNWPDQFDVDDAMDAILRIHNVNHLDIAQFSVGNISGILTGAELNAVHCYEIGVFGREHKYYSLAIEWLELAQEKSLYENSMEKEYIDVALETAIKVHDEEKLKCEGWEPLFFTKPIQNSRRRFKTSREQINLFKGRKKVNFNHINYWSLCQGENLQSEEEKSKLFCWYESKINLVFTIGPIKMEFLARNPDVVQMYNVVGEKEMDNFKSHSANNLTTSRVVVQPNLNKANDTDERRGETGFRISMSYWLVGDVMKKWSNLNINIGLMTGFNVLTNGSAEDLQIATHTFSGHYEPHTDPLGDENLYGKDRGDRLATFMVYLSDVQLGGWTAFPMIGTAANPIKGSAVLWYSLYSDLSEDPDTVHGACPVIMGEKWVGNKWIRGYSQFLTHQCALWPKQRYQFPVNGKITSQKMLKKEKNDILDDEVAYRLHEFSYSSAPSLKLLVVKEKQIYNHIQTVYLQGRCSGSDFESLITAYLKDYEETSFMLLENFVPSNDPETAHLKGEEIVSWNAVASYLMLRRFHHYLKASTWTRIVNDSEVSCGEIQNFLAEEQVKAYWPTEQGYKDSMTAIYNLQSIYDFTSQDISLGYLADADTGLPLNEDVCYEIGKFGVDEKYFTYGIEWLEVAITKMNPTSKKYELAFRELENAMKKHDEDYWKSAGWEPNFYTKPFEKMDDYYNDRVYRKYEQFNAFQDRLESQFSEIRYGGICANKIQQTPAEQSKLFCWYEHEIHSYWKIGPIKAEFHSLEPKLEIVQYHDIVTDKTISNLIQAATPTLRKSTIINALTDNERELNVNIRLSSNSWLSEDESQESYRVSKLIEMITGLDVVGDDLDDLHVTSYTAGSHYSIHLDSASYEPNSENARLGTFMVYLSDVAMGGSTVFAQSGAQIYPSKGSAVFWYNNLASGELNEATWHGSCPIIYGEKWISNKWIHFERQQTSGTLKCHTEKLKINEILVNGQSKYGSTAT